MLRFKGEEFVRKLHGQNISMHAMFAQALNDLIISGEVEASPTIFRNHVLVAIEKKKLRWRGFRWKSYRQAPGAPRFRLTRRTLTRRFCS
jgi:hypothetical protein